MQRQIEDLKRKAEQGSQQLQGEVLELELEAALRANFPHDAIEPVGKGEFGGDVVQRVITPMGQACGALLWETKRTKNWRMAGLLNCAPTNVLPAPNSPFWSRPLCPKELRPSAVSTVYGLPTTVLSCRSPSHFANR
jgi:hypothetical protein